MSREPEMVIPADRLPPGFAQRIGEAVGAPAEPQPAATAVLMRDSIHGIEILLLKRHRSSGFVPGAYVFAGGRVDEADGDAELLKMVAGASLNPAPAYWLATVREVFEETGILLARGRNGESCMTVEVDPRLAELRESLMSDRATLRDVLLQLDVQPDFASLAYAAHWITPLAEPRRYDTRFFYAAAPADCEATADEREMSDAVWLTAPEALDRFRAGRLPMVFPTVRTIEGLLDYPTVADALSAARASEVKPILPSLVRVDGGVAIVIDADEPDRTSR